LAPGILDEAERSHPVVLENGVRRRSTSCPDLEAMAAPCDIPLTPVPPEADTLAFASGNLPAVRQLAAAVAGRAGLDPVRAAEFCLAAHELATNSVRHGGGEGVLSLWCDDESLMCEIRDQGDVEDPLAGRRQPSEGDRGGRGLWIANQVCDLVQIRAVDGGSQIRLRLNRERPTRAPAPDRVR
jgi:anti-sigma regulatory factor (Ser/Thr protein kinase)